MSSRYFPNSRPKIILASTSPFRKQLLEKLHLPFDTAKPNIDETPLKGELVLDMVNRLSLAKAKAIADRTPGAIIIGSDQSACFNGSSIGKPHNHEAAKEQLHNFSGQTVEFITGLAVIDTRNNTNYQHYDLTQVHFRKLSEIDIENYLNTEQPYQCAGSFKSEGLGITLLEEITSRDPNALIGLPLIALTTILKQCNIVLPSSSSPSP